MRRWVSSQGPAEKTRYSVLSKTKLIYPTRSLAEPIAPLSHDFVAHLTHADLKLRFSVLYSHSRSRIRFLRHNRVEEDGVQIYLALMSGVFCVISDSLISFATSST